MDEFGKEQSSSNPFDFTQNQAVQDAQYQAGESVVLGKPILSMQDDNQFLEDRKAQREKFDYEWSSLSGEYDGSYTTYYEKHGVHLGSEYFGKQQLRKEKQIADYQKVRDGLLTEEEYLMDNYAYDYLEAQGHRVKDAMYWYNKIMNNDTYNPLTNSMVMDQAMSYGRQKLLTETFYNEVTSVSPEDMFTIQQLSDIGDDLTTEQFTDVFEHLKTTGLDDVKEIENVMEMYKKLGQAFYLNKDGEQVEFDPFIRDKDGKVIAVFKEDGELYRVSDDKSAKAAGDHTLYARYNQTTGELMGLQDTNDIFVFGRSAINGIADAFMGMAEMGVVGIAGVFDAAETLITGDEYGDWVGDAYGMFQGIRNDMPWLFDNGYIDMDKDNISMTDISAFTGKIAGTLLGMYALGNAGGLLADAGAGVGSKSLQAAGNLLTRSSGLYTGAGKKAVKSTASQAIKHSVLRNAVAKEHAKLVSTYFIKDFVDNMGYHHMRYNLNEEFKAAHPGSQGFMDSSRGKIVTESLQAAGANAFISAFLAGGRDDSAVQRLNLFSGRFSRGTIANSQVAQYLAKATKGQVFANFFMDLADNYMTMTIDASMKQTGEFSLAALPQQFADGVKNPHVVAMSILMAGQTAGGSRTSHIDVMGEILKDAPGRTRTAVLNKADELIKTNDEQKIKAGESLKELVKEADRNRELFLRGETTGYNKAIGELPKTFEIEGTSSRVHGANLIFMETVKAHSGGKTVDNILNQLSMSTRHEVYKMMYNEADTAHREITEKKKGMFRAAFRGVKGLGKFFTMNYKNIPEETRKALQSLESHFKKLGTGEIGRDMFYSDNINIENVYAHHAQASRHFENEAIDKEFKFLDNEEEISKVQAASDMRDGFVFDISGDSEAAANLRKAAMYLDKNSDHVEFVTLDDKTYIVVDQSNMAASTAQVMNFANIAKGFDSIYREASPEDIYYFITALDPNNVDIQRDAKGKINNPNELANVAITKLSELITDGEITRERAAELLSMLESGGEARFDYVDSKAPMIRYYRGFKSLLKVKALASKGEMDNGKFLSAVGELLTADGEAVVDPQLAKDFEDDFNILREQYQKVQEGIDANPKVLRQILKNSTAVSYTKRHVNLNKDTVNRISKLLNIKPEVIENSIVIDRDPNLIEVRIDSFLTKSEAELIKKMLQTNNADKDPQEFLNSDELDDDFRSRFAFEMRKKQQWLETNSDPVIKFNKGSKEWEDFAYEMGYKSLRDIDSFLNQAGVIHPGANPLGIKIRLTKAGMKQLKKQKIEKEYLDLTDEQAYSYTAEHNAAGGVVADENSLISVNDIVPSVLDDITLDLNAGQGVGNTLTGFQVKASISAGDAKGVRHTLTALTSRILTGKRNQSHYKYLETERMIQFIVDNVKPHNSLVVPANKVEDYKDYIGQDIEKYFKNSIWLVEYNDKGDLIFNLNQDKVNPKAEGMRFDIYKEINDSPIFRLIPLIPEVKQVPVDYNNKGGVELFSIAPSKAQARDLVWAVSQYEGQIEHNNNPRDMFIKMLNNKEVIKTKTDFTHPGTGNMKEIELKRDMTIAELKKELEKYDTDNYWVQSILKQIKAIEQVSEDTIKQFGSKRKAILGTDPTYRAIIMSVYRRNPDLPKYDMYREVMKELNKQRRKFKRSDSTTKPGRSKTEYMAERKANQLASLDLTATTEVRNRLPIEITPEEIDDVIKILTKGIDEYKKTHREISEIHRGQAGLQAFIKGDSLEIPLTEISHLEPDEIDFIRTSSVANHKDVITDAVSKYGRESIGNLKVSRLKEGLYSTEQASVELNTRGTFRGIRNLTLNGLHNKAILNSMKYHSLNKNHTAPVREMLLDSLQSDMMNDMVKMVMDELTDSVGAPGVVSYDLSTQRGRQMFVNDIGETYETIARDIFGLTPGNLPDGYEPEFFDNLIRSAATIVVNGKGSKYYNQMKNGFFIDKTSGKIRDYSRNTAANDHFFKKIMDAKPEDLKDTKLVVPRENNYTGYNKPEFDFLDMNDKNIQALKDEAIIDTLKRDGYERIQEYDVSDARQEAALERRFNRNITHEETVNSMARDLIDNGMHEEAARRLLSQEQTIDEMISMFTDNETREVLLNNLLYDEDRANSSMREEMDIIAYGEIRTKEEMDSHNKVTKMMFDSKLLPITKRNMSKPELEFRQAMAEWIQAEREAYVTTRRNQTTDKVAEAEAKVREILEANPKAEWLRDAIIDAHLLRNNDASMLKHLNNLDSKIDQGQTHKHKQIELEGKNYVIFDEETIFGKVFIANTTDVTYKDGKPVVGESKNMYLDKSAFTKEELEIIRTLVDREPLTNKQKEYIAQWNIDFSKDNEGYRQNLEDLLKDTEGSLKKEFKARLSRKGYTAVGYNSKAADLKWALENKLITQAQHDRLQNNSIDVLKDLIIDAGINVGGSYKETLERVKEILREVEEFKDMEVLKGDSHDAKTDALVTALALKYFADQYNKDETYDIRNKHKLDLFKRLDDLGIKYKKKEVYQRAADVKAEYLKRTEGLMRRNEYENTNANIKGALKRRQVIRDNLDYAHIYRELNKLGRKEIPLSAQTTENLRKGGDRRFMGMAKYVYAQLDNFENPDVRTQKAFEVIANAFGGGYSYRKLIDNLLDPSFFNTDTFTAVADEINKLNKSKNLTGNDVDSDYRRREQRDEDGMQLIDGIEGTTHYKTADVGNFIENNALIYTRTATKKRLEDLGVSKDIMEPLINYLTATHIKDVDVDRDPVLGKSLTSDGVKNLFDTVKEVATRTKIAGGHTVMITSAGEGSLYKLSEARVHPDLLERHGIDPNQKGDIYLPLMRDPGVIAGAFMSEVKVVADDTVPMEEVRVSAEMMKKLSGDFDGDMPKLYLPNSKEELDVIRTIGELTRIPFDKAEQMINAAYDYTVPRDFTGHMKGTKFESDINTKKFKTKFKTDLKKINDAPAASRKQVYLDTMKQYSTEEQALFKTVGLDERSPETYYKVTAAHPTLEYTAKEIGQMRRDKYNSHRLSKQHKLGVTVQTQTFGHFNKKLNQDRTFETKMPLTEFFRTKFRFTDAPMEALKVAINKAIDAEDRDFIEKKLGLDYEKTFKANRDETLEAFLDEHIQQVDEAYRNDEANNKKLIKATKKFLKSGETIYEQTVKQIDDIANKLKELGVSSSEVDYVVNGGRDNDAGALLHYTLEKYHNAYDLDSTYKLLKKPTGTTRSVLFINPLQEGIKNHSEDIAFGRPDLFKGMDYYDYKKVKISEAEYRKLKEEMDAKKTLLDDHNAKINANRLKIDEARADLQRAERNKLSTKEIKLIQKTISDLETSIEELQSKKFYLSVKRNKLEQTDGTHKSSKPIYLNENNLHTINGERYAVYGVKERLDGKAVKTSHLKSVILQGRDEAEAEILKPFFEQADMVFDYALFKKRRHLLDPDIKMSYVRINGRQYLKVDNLRTTAINGNMFFSHDKDNKFSTNNQAQVSTEGAESIYMFGGLMSSVDKEGNFIHDPRGYMDIIENLKHNKRTPYMQSNNFIPKIQMLRAQVLAGLIKEQNSESVKYDPNMLDPEYLMLLKGWGSDTGAGYVNYLKDLYTKVYRKGENNKSSFEDLLKLHGNPHIERLFKTYGEIGVTTKKMSTVQRATGQPVTSKGTGDIETTDGIITNSASDTPIDGAPVSDSKTTEFMHPEDFFRNAMGIGINMHELGRAALEGRGVYEKGKNMGIGDNFNVVSVDGYETKNGLPKNIVSGDPKSAHEGNQTVTTMRPNDPNRIVKLERDLQTRKNLPIEVNMPGYSNGVNKWNVALGMYKALGQLEGKTDADIARGFKSEGTLDNVTLQTDRNKIEIRDSKLRGTLDVQRTKGRYEDLQKDLKERKNHSLVYRQLEETKYRERLSPEAMDRVKADINRNNTLNLNESLKGFGKTLEGNPLINKPSRKVKEQSKNYIISSTGEVKEATFKVNKKAIGEEQVKQNWLETGGASNKTDAGFHINDIVGSTGESGRLIMHDLDTDLHDLHNELINKQVAKDFTRYTNAKRIYMELTDKGDKSIAKALMQKFEFNSKEEVEAAIVQFQRENAMAASLHDRITASLLKHSDKITSKLNEPFNTFALINPYLPKAPTQKMKLKLTRDLIRGLITLDTDLKTALEKHTSNDYLDSVGNISNRLAQAYQVEAMSHSLRERGLITNKEILDAFDYSTEEFTTLIKDYKFEADRDGLGIESYIDVLSKISPSNAEYRKLLSMTGYTKDTLVNIYSEMSKEIMSSEYSKFSTEDLKPMADSDPEALKVLNLMEMKAYVIRDLIKGDTSLINKIYENIEAQAKIQFGDEAVIVDKFGREINSNKAFKSLYPGSLEFLYKELTFHDDKDMYKLNVIEQALKGNVFYGNRTTSEHLNKHFYTETEYWGLRSLKKFGKVTSELIMASPLKLIDRVLTYSMFDASQAAMVSPKSFMLIPEAIKTLRAYKQTNGKVSTPELDAYYLMKGFNSQEAKDRDVILKEKIHSELNHPEIVKAFKGVSSISKEALDLQSDNVRFALFLSLTRQFESGSTDKNIYGPTYGYKDKIDSIKDETSEEASKLGHKINGQVRPLTAAEKKAYKVMAQTFGNPGQFPLLAKKLSGLLVFNTFSLSFTRSTAGLTAGWVMQMKEALREGDPKRLMRGVAPVGLGLAGTIAMYEIVAAFLENVVGYEEDEDKKKEEGRRPIAPLGTLLTGGFTQSNDYFNPFDIAKDMWYTPIAKAFDDEYDDEGGMNNYVEAGLRLLSSNALSRTNPLIKNVAEIATGKDLYGDDIYDTRYQYNVLDNIIRKGGGYLLGGSLAKSIVDAYKLDKYADDDTVKLLVSGVGTGIANELGNSRSYKRGKSSFYKARGKINAKRYLDNSMRFADYTQEDLMAGGLREPYESGYDKEDATKLYNQFNRAIRQKAHPSIYYGIILDFLNEEQGHPDTARAVVNKLSVRRRLNQLKDPQAYINSLSEADKRQLNQAIQWEMENFPVLYDMDLSTKKNNYEKKMYTPKEYIRAPYERNYSPRTYRAPYYRSPFADYGSYQNKKQDVTRVSNKMGIWDKDKQFKR